MALSVITDSTADLPPDIIRDLGVTVVPLNVHFGTDVYKDGVNLSSDEFYERLAAGGKLPKTSQPSVGDFVSVYEELGAHSDGILSVHLSAKVSGTYGGPGALGIALLQAEPT
jgi:DegV family protein with EDD domain